ncbi:MAG: hypothetical protein RL077_4881 [Verrucomicrobiota bacterium]
MPTGSSGREPCYLPVGGEGPPADAGCRLPALGPTELKDIEDTFREIAETPVPADELGLQTNSIRAELNCEAAAYGGVRVRFVALLGPVKCRCQSLTYAKEARRGVFWHSALNNPLASRPWSPGDH